jgi:hypothetical protein
MKGYDIRILTLLRTSKLNGNKNEICRQFLLTGPLTPSSMRQQHVAPPSISSSQNYASSILRDPPLQWAYGSETYAELSGGRIASIKFRGWEQEEC